MRGKAEGAAPSHRVARLTAETVPLAIALAARIWPVAFSGFLPPGQVDYMLALRSSPEYFAPYLDGGEGSEPTYLLVYSPEAAIEPRGYLSFRTLSANEVRLEQLYLESDLHGSGVAAALVGLVRSAAAAGGRQRVSLTVNRHNQRAISFYRRIGFTVVADVTVAIGGGYVMDDHVMEIPSAPDGPTQATVRAGLRRDR